MGKLTALPRASDPVVGGEVAGRPLSKNRLRLGHSGLGLRSYGPRSLVPKRDVVVSGVRRMNEVNARRARLVPGWVTVFGRVYHYTISVCNKPTRSTQPCIPRGRLIEYQLRLG